MSKSTSKTDLQVLIEWLFKHPDKKIQYFVHPKQEIGRNFKVPSSIPSVNIPFIPSQRTPKIAQDKLDFELYRAVAMQQTHGKLRKKKVKNTVILGDFVASTREKALEMAWKHLRSTHKNPDGSVHLKNVVVVSDKFDADWSKIPGLTDPRLPVCLESGHISDPVGKHSR